MKKNPGPDKLSKKIECSILSFCKIHCFTVIEEPAALKASMYFMLRWHFVSFHEQYDVNTEHTDFCGAFVSWTWQMGELHRWRSYATKPVTGCYKQCMPKLILSKMDDFKEWQSSFCICGNCHEILIAPSVILEYNQFETAGSKQYCKLAKVALSSHNLCRCCIKYAETLTIRTIYVYAC